MLFGRPNLLILLAAGLSFGQGICVTTPEDYGAVGDGKANDWLAIQRAVDSCRNATSLAGCRVDFRQQYLSGPVVVKSSGVTLNVSGQLAMLPKSDYPHQGAGFVSVSGD